MTLITCTFDDTTAGKTHCVTCGGIGKVLIHDLLIGKCSDCNGSGKEPTAKVKTHTHNYVPSLFDGGGTEVCDCGAWR